MPAAQAAAHEVTLTATPTAAQVAALGDRAKFLGSLGYFLGAPQSLGRNLAKPWGIVLRWPRELVQGLVGPWTILDAFLGNCLGECLLSLGYTVEFLGALFGDYFGKSREAVGEILASSWGHGWAFASPPVKFLAFTGGFRGGG